MSHTTLRIRLPLVLLAMIFCLCLPAAGQHYNFTASLLGGISGSFDADPDPGFGNTALQLGFAWVTDRRAQVGVRLGQMDFGSEILESLTDADLTYVNIAGEYRFSEGYYTSGVFLGLGLYSVDGTPILGGDGGDEGIGLTIGVNGDFEINRKFSILVELAGHFADVDGANSFGNLLVGVGYKFR